MTPTLGDLASEVRSKNAGPFWLTLDIFFVDEETCVRVSHSAVTNPETIGRLYGVDPAAVKVFVLPDLFAIKLSFPRPVVQGSLQDRDVHGGQQYVPLLSLPLDSFFA
jgi:hypothetical protein